jgi:hypothetical protein
VRRRNVAVAARVLVAVAVLTAVMIWRVMQSSAKLRKRGLAIRAEVADRLVEADEPSWMRSSESPPMRKYDDALRRTNEW